MNKKIYLFRDEGLWALQDLALHDKEANWGEFVKGLCSVFESNLNGQADIVVHALPAVQRAVQEMTSGEKTISLDTCVSGDINLGISRHFLPGGTKLIALGERPGYESLDKQIAAITPGEYALVEDDIFTGTTMNYVMKILAKNSGVIIKRVAVGLKIGESELSIPVESYASYDPKTVLNISDPRDYLVGSKSSGLVIEYPNGILGRAPYILPFVDPYARASIPQENTLSFSRQIWELNCIFWKNYPDVMVRDTELTGLADIIKTDTDTTMLSFCEKMSGVI